MTDAARAGPGAAVHSLTSSRRTPRARAPRGTARGGVTLVEHRLGLALYGMVVSLVAPIGGFTLAAISQAATVWLSVNIAGALLTAFAVGVAVLGSAAEVDAEPGRQYEAAADHGVHLGRYPIGFLHPGHFRPLTVGLGRKEPHQRAGSPG